MIRNYLKTALRNILRSKGHSVINVFGLSVAMGLCILIFLLVRQELSYDDFHEKGANVFRVTQTAFMGEYRTIGMTPVPLGPTLEDAYAGIVRTVRYANAGPVLVSYGDVTVREETVFRADPVGKWLTMDDRRHQVAAVARVPANTIFQFDFLISMKTLTDSST